MKDDPAHALAKLALLVLDTQGEYFRTRDRATLLKAKALERKLRVECESILAEPEPNLFSGSE